MIKLKDTGHSKKVLVFATHLRTIYTLMLQLGGYDVPYAVTTNVTYTSFKRNVDRFIREAKSLPTYSFYITDSFGDPVDAWPLFVLAPLNCIFPRAWEPIVSKGMDKKRRYWDG